MAYVPVAFHPQGQVVNIPLVNGKLKKQTLLSQFPGATGLKFNLEGVWTAVNVEGDEFVLPVNGGNLYIVVTNAVEIGRQVLSNNQNLASQVSRVFSRTGRTGSSASPLVSASYRNGSSRNDGRSCRLNSKTSQKKGFCKTFKVAFIKDVTLPATLSRSIVLMDAMITITSLDDEMNIKTKLLGLLNNNTDFVYTVNQLRFLTCGERKLSVPHVSVDFEWNGDNLKTCVGQGKMYIQVISMEEQEQDSSGKETHAGPFERNDHENNSDSDFENSGTPTVAFRRRRLHLPLHEQWPIDVPVSGPISSVVSSTSVPVSVTTRVSVPLTESVPVAVRGISPPLSITASASITPVSATSIPCHAPVTPNVPISSNIPADISVDDGMESLDEDMEMAIQASLGLTTNSSMETILKAWILNSLIESDESEEVIIHRRRIWESTKKATTRPHFSLQKSFRVTFSGEIGADEGGPKREYLSLLMKAIENRLLEGRDGKRNFIHSLKFLEQQDYNTAGKFVGWSLLHGGPGLTLLHPSIYNAIVGKDPIFEVEDILDMDLLEKIKMIRDGSEEDINSLMDWLIDQGIELTPANREQMSKQLLKNHLYFRVHAEITQFINGLNVVGGLGDILKEYPEQMTKLFTHSDDQILTSQALKKLYKINFSENGSNRRTKEEDTLYHFECFLQDCDDTNSSITIKEVLEFWTGSNAVPPLGFSKALEIDFVTDNDRSNKLPVAHTCGMNLELVRGIDNSERMLESMTKAIKWGGEFHLA